MTDLLAGITVGLFDPARPLAVAARCLADLGATVRRADMPAAPDVDRLWLGDPEPLAAGERVDIALAGGEGDAGRARTTVHYVAVSSAAANAGQDLSERELCAVGGMAVAIGDPQRPPLPLPEGSLEAMIGTHIAAAGLGALITGVERTEVAGADVAAWAVATNLQLYLPYGLSWFRAGRRANGSGSCYPYALFDAADGLFCMIGRTDADWAALKAAMGNPAWGQTPRFDDPRVVGRRYPEEADRHVDPWARERTRDELLGIMVDHGFPGAPVLRPDEVLAWPSLADRWRRVDHDGGQIAVPGPVFDVETASSARPAKQFSDLLVLDLSWVWSGPAVSVALADLGANVIKIESSNRPDNSRMRGRPDGAPETAPALSSAPYFHALNRGKRSLTLDLRSEGGRAVLQDLAARADVIIENLSAGVMDRFGIPPERVLEVNPDCVFLSMRGYRDHPTTRGLRAYAPALSSSAGLEAMVAYPGEDPIGAMTVAFSDALAAGQGVLMALAGLYRRSAGEGGGALVLSQLEAAVLANGHNLVAAQLGGAADGLQPIDDATEVTTAESLVGSGWLSPEQLDTIEPPGVGPVRVSRLPWRRDGELPGVGAAAPTLGDHTDELLVELLGTQADRIDSLRQGGALT
jgi:crotonobetainyl-CoA:carnitine CoA-transferase CaiB-like acyl-CoA transferase